MKTKKYNAARKTRRTIKSKVNKINNLKGGGLNEHQLKDIENKINDLNETELNCSNLDINNEDVVKIVKLLQNNTTIITLNFSSNHINYNGIIALANLLKTNTTITSLDISNNKIGDNGLQELTEVLKTNNTITVLNIRKNKIGDNGAIEIAEVLKTNKTLISLDIGNNNIGDMGGIAIFKALEFNVSLKTLSFSYNNFSNNCIKHIKALQQNKTLISLDIGNNNIDSNGAIEIAEVLKINNTLTEINISNNKIGESGTIAIADALKINKTLKKLDISNNKIGNIGASALYEALKINNTLAKLDISMNISINSDIINNIDTHFRFNPPLETYNTESSASSASSASSITSTNNNILVDKNIQFIKDNISSFKNLSNNNTIDTVFNDQVNNLTISYDYFKSLINNNYINGLEAITSKVFSNANKKIIIDLHGQISKSIFQLPKNINIIYLTPIDYLACYDFITIKPSIIKHFDDYLKNPTCFEHTDIINIFNQAIIYYGGQYCIDLSLSREDVDHVSGIYGMNDSNELLQDISVLGNIPNFDSGYNKILLSKLLLNTNPQFNYTILIGSCREFPNEKNILEEDIFVFYEQTIKLLNLKINYDNLEPKLKDVEKLNNYVKKCKTSNKLNLQINNINFEQSFKNNNINNINKRKVSSRVKSNINGDTIIEFKNKNKTLNEIATIVSTEIDNSFVKTRTPTFNFHYLYTALPILSLYKIYDENYVSIHNIDIIKKLKIIFRDNYNSLLNYMVYCQKNIMIKNEKGKYIYNNNKTNSNKLSLLKLFINNIPELKFLDSIKIIEDLNKKDAKFIAEYLKINTLLKIIDFSNNTFNDTSIITIVRELLYNTSIIKFNISNNNISDSDANVIAVFLQHNKTLRELNINKNKIGDYGAKYIANALIHNNILTLINISYNNIGERGAIDIAELLKVNSSIKMINISGNIIKDRGVIAIAKALETNKTLKYLLINNCNIGDFGANAIAHLLQKNKNLSHLLINNNNISDKGANAIFNTLQNNKSIRSLQINNNKTSISILAKFNDFFKKRMKLLEANLPPPPPRSTETII